MSNRSSVDKFADYVFRSDWRHAAADCVHQHVDEALELFDCDEDDLPGIIGAGFTNAIYDAALEDFMTYVDDDGKNPVDDYLRRRGYAETATSKRYLQALRTATMSLYEVSDIVPGASFMARDLIGGGEPVRVVERIATERLKQWDCIGTRLVQMGSEWRMSGVVFPYQPEDSKFLTEVLTIKPADLVSELRDKMESDELAKEFDAIADEFEDAIETGAGRALLFTTVWLEQVHDILHGPGPKLTNSDGDEIVFCTLVFRFRPGVTAASVQKKIKALPDFVRVDDGVFHWLPGSNAVDARGETIAATIEIQADHVEISTNSRKRADIAEALLVKTLSGLVDDVERDEEEGPDFEGGTLVPPNRPPGGALEMTPELAAVLRDFQDKHYRRTLDEPVPALGNVTPRAAAKTKAGRDMIVAWLKDLENGTARAQAHGEAGYDFTWMWAELGVAGRRV